MGEGPVAAAPPSRRSSLAELISTDQSTNKHCHHSRRFAMKSYGVLTGGVVGGLILIGLPPLAMHGFTNNFRRVRFWVGISAQVARVALALLVVVSPQVY